MSMDAVPDDSDNAEASQGDSKKVEASQDPAEAETSQGRFLLSLESELLQDNSTIDAAIRLHSLFSRRVCLPDSHLIDSPALETFFEEHEMELQKEVEHAREFGRPPMLGTLSRADADISRALDIMLTPNERTGLPSYFSRLLPEQNDHFRQSIANVHTSEERRASFLEITGNRFTRHLGRATKYFQEHRLSVVPRARISTNDLYQAVRDQILLLREQSKSKIQNADRPICDALLREMEASGVQTRERLHLAIYGGVLPHYHQGELQAPYTKGDEFRHPWRHLVNTLYCDNLADKYACEQVRNSEWFQLPSCLELEQYSPGLDKAEKVDNIDVIPLYLDHLTIDFISDVRTEDAFWTSLDEMEKANVLGDRSKYWSAYKEHLLFVMERFSKHLTDKVKQPELARTKRVDVWEGYFNRFLLSSSMALVFGAAWKGVPTESVVTFMTNVAKSSILTAPTYFVVKGMLKWKGGKVPNPKLKSFEAYVKGMTFHSTHSRSSSK